MSNNNLEERAWAHEGEFYPASQKKFQEIVLFVPFYMGTKRHILRHIRFVNELGFDAFAFELAHDHRSLLKGKIPLTSQFKFGSKHVYAEQIESILNELPGKKIVFAFSNPSASAIEAIAKRNASDVVALIADSGPTNRFINGAFQLFKYELGLEFLPARLALAPLMSYGWSPYLHKDVHTDLEKFPHGFKILSIRGWQDKLIKPQHIDEIFEPHTHLDWQKLSLPQAEHLTGLRDFANDYRPAVEKFLTGVATKL
ncbi:MAG: hypothetical protein ACLGGX_05420 [Bdellovibrionia bacterium]